MSHITVVDALGELYLDAHDPLVIACGDEVHLTFAAFGPEVRHAGFAGLGEDTDAERRERLEEGTEERAIAADGRRAFAGQQCAGRQPRWRRRSPLSTRW